MFHAPLLQRHRSAAVRHHHPQRPMSLEAAAQAHDLALAAGARAEKTRAWYLRVVVAFSTFLATLGISEPTILDITAERVRGFVLYLQSTPSANPATGALRPRGKATVRQYVVGIRGLVSFLLDEGKLTENPLRRVRLPRAPIPTVVPFTGAEIRRLLEAAEQGTMPERDAAIVLLLLSTGVRAAELCGLRLKDLDVDGGRATVWGKGSKQRGVLFEDQQVKAALWRYLGVRPMQPMQKMQQSDGAFFRLENGGAMTTKALGLLLTRLGARAGVDDVHPHRFRHSMAVAWLSSHPGAVVHLRVLLGHSDLATTERYARVVAGREHLPGLTVLEALGVG